MTRMRSTAFTLKAGSAYALPKLSDNKGLRKTAGLGTQEEHHPDITRQLGVKWPI